MLSLQRPLVPRTTLEPLSATSVRTAILPGADGRTSTLMVELTWANSAHDEAPDNDQALAAMQSIGQVAVVLLPDATVVTVANTSLAEPLRLAPSIASPHARACTHLVIPCTALIHASSVTVVIQTSAQRAPSTISEPDVDAACTTTRKVAPMFH